ncbi:ribosome silencing factor [Ligilactobacillus ceti]|uniref:Ribosomal silencing factor RsfS n=1 Tax=Ligilactobacillus ceti DSM 22408 TaxID=1122146 RepID=A0A0R2KGM7_9LACO|nr:ribosome silencing factor [Ligilactobacillus ceti]KRN88537.1 Iojap-related protein [Ligilactobacillus ceti DSM 22408]
MNSKELLQVVVEAGDRKRAENIIALDVEKVSLLADYFVIMQGGSERQVKAISEEIAEQVHKAGGTIKSIEGRDGANWILVDLGDVIVHIFKEEAREFYKLEKLWSDAEMVDIEEWVD